jgi:hypothetical protein
VAVYDVRCDICGTASEVLAPSPLDAEQAACMACSGPVRLLFRSRFTIVERPVELWPVEPARRSPSG